MVIFTSIALNYLPKARVLAQSIRRLHPDWEFHLVISDRISYLNQSIGLMDVAQDPFTKIVWIEDLPIPDFNRWIFRYSVVEVCTAVKGLYLQQLMREGVDKVIYLDPDIVVFNSLSDLSDLLKTHAILLTPHLLDYPETEQSIRDNEIMGVLKHGIFNLGFFAVDLSRRDGHRFAEWWGHRLQNYCFADYELNLFTDQKWCDLVPAYFPDSRVIHDPGYNVASWNIDKRSVSLSKRGQLMVNDRFPLRFFHFTGYDSGAGAMMTERYAGHNQVVKEIWQWYGHSLVINEQSTFGRLKNHYAYYDNGQEIKPNARKLYRERRDLQEAFPDPYQAKSVAGKPHGGYYGWYLENADKE